MYVGYLLRKHRDVHTNEYFFVPERMCTIYIKYLDTYFRDFFGLLSLIKHMAHVFDNDF